MNTPLRNISSLLKKVNKLLSPTASAHASHQRCSSSNNHDDNKSSSHFQSTVCLYDWWLIRSDEIFKGKRLAVAGYTSRELKARRIFTSAPIVKQYDIFTVESADGICIILKGLMNKLRAKENGFSAEDFSHFLFGFPPSWEAYNKKCLEEEFTTGPSLATIPDTNGSATGHDGMKNANPNTTPINYEEECPMAKSSNVENLNSSNLDPAMPVGDSSLDLIITSTKSKTQDPSCLESTSSNAASEECPIPKASDVENLISSNLDPAVPMGDSGLDLRITRKSNTQESAELMPKISECSDGKNLKRCSSGTTIHSGKKKDILEAALSQSWKSIYKMVRNKMGSVDSATLVSDGTSNLEGINIFDFYDNHLCESEAAVGERKINFDIPASHLTQGRKENIVFPESLSFKRSRSGRLLLPSLDFWRNQIAVYDADHKIIGIQVVTPSKFKRLWQKKKVEVHQQFQGFMSGDIV